MSRLLLLLLVVLAGCAGGPGSVGEVIPGAIGTKAPHITFHMDVDFTPSERAAAQAASDAWRHQTGGLAQIDLKYDLNFADVDGLMVHELELHNMVVRRESWMEVVQEEDAASCPSRPEGCVLGWMTSGGIHNPWSLTVQGAFVMDRLTAPPAPATRMVQVMMHEFGHALGLPHVAAIQSIMYPSVTPGRTSCLKLPDLVAFCTVNSCGSTRMLPCE